MSAVSRRLPMARVWPPSKFGIQSYPAAHVHVELPPQHVQDKLIDLYFTNIHPIFPVIHKTRFLAEYRSRCIITSVFIAPSLIKCYVTEHRGLTYLLHKEPPTHLEYSEGVDFRDSPSSHSGSTYSSPRPEPTQEVTRLLLFSIFAIAARFTDDNLPQDNKMWEAGCDYLDSARNILSLSFIQICLCNPYSTSCSASLSCCTTLNSAILVASGV